MPFQRSSIHIVIARIVRQINDQARYAPDDLEAARDFYLELLDNLAPSLGVVEKRTPYDPQMPPEQRERYAAALRAIAMGTLPRGDIAALSRGSLHGRTTALVAADISAISEDSCAICNGVIRDGNCEQCDSQFPPLFQQLERAR